MQNRIVTIVIMALFSLMYGSPYLGHAASNAPKAKLSDQKSEMDRHVERVKVSAPQKYREMIERAGGAATKCTDCHIEVLKAKSQGR